MSRSRRRFPRFSLPRDPIAIDLPAGCRWVTASDFTGPLAVIGRARARFGAAVAAFDADGDGKLDLYLCSAVSGPEGVHDALLINRGENTYRDATDAFGLADDRASLGVAAGDFDADGRIDLFLTGVGTTGSTATPGKKFEDVTSRSGIAGPPAVSLTARWLDLDQDGDLDLYVVNHASAAESERLLRRPARPAAACPTPRTATTASPPRSPGRPQSNWAPLAMAPADLARNVGALDRVHTLARRRRTLRRSGAEYRRSPHSTSTTTATSTWSLAPTASRSGRS